MTAWWLLPLLVGFGAFLLLRMQTRASIEHQERVAFERVAWETRQMARQLDPEWANRLDALVPVVDYSERILVTNPSIPNCAHGIMTRDQFERDWRWRGWVDLGPAA